VSETSLFHKDVTRALRRLACGNVGYLIKSRIHWDKSLKRRRYLSKRHFYEDHVRVDEKRPDPLMVKPEFVQRGVEWKEIVEQALATLAPTQRLSRILDSDGLQLA